MFFHFKALATLRLLSNGALLLRRASKASLLLALALLTLALASQTFAQDPESADDVVRVRTDLITVPVFVMDARGRRISGLRKEDFLLLDDGRAVEAQYFATGAERVALLFALDASGSTREIIQEQRETALALFSRFGSGSRVAILRFTEHPDLALSFTTNSNEALAAFNFNAFVGQKTAIFDAALASVRLFDTRGMALERRIVVLISDGLDTASTVGATQVINAALERGVSFYIIHLPLYAPRDGRLAVRPPAKGFRDLAQKTGGKYFLLGDAKLALAARPQYNLSPIFEAIEEDLKGQYLLGFYPTEAARNQSPHRIEVSLASGNNRKLRVQALRKEYMLRNEK